MVNKMKIKIIVKDAYSNESPIEFFIEPEKTTCAEFAKIYLAKLSQRYIYSIEPSLYKMRNNVICDDFNFHIAGASSFDTRSRYISSMLLSKLIQASEITNNSLTVYARLNVYGINNFPLSRDARKTVPSLSKLCLFKIKMDVPSLSTLCLLKLKGMIDENIVTRDNIKNVLPKDAVVPTILRKMINR